MRTSFAAAALVATAIAGNTAEWKSKTVYQLLTDRFAKTDGSTNACTNLSDYCGGTFVGVQN